MTGRLDGIHSAKGAIFSFLYYKKPLHPHRHLLKKSPSPLSSSFLFTNQHRVFFTFSKMKLTAFAAIMVAFLTTGAFTYPITGEVVNCRSGPGTSYPVKKTYNKG
jgi:hypothetical protein